MGRSICAGAFFFHSVSRKNRNVCPLFLFYEKVSALFFNIFCKKQIIIDSPSYVWYTFVKNTESSGESSWV